MIKYILHIRPDDEYTDVRIEAERYEDFLEKLGAYERGESRYEHELQEDQPEFKDGGLFSNKRILTEEDLEEMGVEQLENERQDDLED